MGSFKKWWHKITGGNDCECDECVTSDCNCGCGEHARDSVRLTDAEIAEDVLGDINLLCDAYTCMCDEGENCTDKLCSCVKCRDTLTEYVQKNESV